MPLPVPGAGKIYWEYGVRGLASPDPLMGAAQHSAGKGLENSEEVIKKLKLEKLVDPLLMKTKSLARPAPRTLV